jgi:hypothetical protein
MIYDHDFVPIHIHGWRTSQCDVCFHYECDHGSGIRAKLARLWKRVGGWNVWGGDQ